MSLSSLAAVSLSILALAGGNLAPSGGSADGVPEVPGDVQIDLNNNPYILVSGESLFQAVGDGMINAAEAALPVGVSVMAVTAGIPVAKKVIKQLGT